MVFNTTFNNILVLSWGSVLFVEEIGVPWENHRPVASHLQTLSHNIVSVTRRHEQYSNSQHQCAEGTDCTGSIESGIKDQYPNLLCHILPSMNLYDNQLIFFICRRPQWENQTIRVYRTRCQSVWCNQNFDNKSRPQTACDRPSDGQRSLYPDTQTHS